MRGELKRPPAVSVANMRGVVSGEGEEGEGVLSPGSSPSSSPSSRSAHSQHLRVTDACIRRGIAALGLSLSAGREESMVALLRSYASNPGAAGMDEALRGEENFVKGAMKGMGGLLRAIHCASCEEDSIELGRGRSDTALRRRSSRSEGRSNVSDGDTEGSGRLRRRSGSMGAVVMRSIMKGLGKTPPPKSVNEAGKSLAGEDVNDESLQPNTNQAWHRALSPEGLAPPPIVVDGSLRIPPRPSSPSHGPNHGRSLMRKGSGMLRHAVSAVSRSRERSKSAFVESADNLINLASAGNSVHSLSSPRGERAKVIPGMWKRGLQIGKGSFGSVYIGINEHTSDLIAVKALSITAMSSPKAADEAFSALVREVTVMKKLKHPNIVRYLGAELHEADKKIYIFQEWVPASVTTLLDNFGPFQERRVALYTRQILEGLVYLHSHGVMHRDIKGSNILIDDRGVVKLCDFGASKLLEDDHLHCLGFGDHTTVGSPLFMAPEILLRQNYGPQIDIWSLGGAVLQMVTGKPPWASIDPPLRTHVALVKWIRSHDGEGLNPVPKDVALSDELQIFLRRCFRRDPTKRPTAAQLLMDDFLDVTLLAPPMADKGARDMDSMSPGVALERIRRASFNSLEMAQNQNQNSPRRMPAGTPNLSCITMDLHPLPPKCASASSSRNHPGTQGHPRQASFPSPSPVNSVEGPGAPREIGSPGSVNSGSMGMSIPKASFGEGDWVVMPPTPGTPGTPGRRSSSLNPYSGRKHSSVGSDVLSVGDAPSGGGGLDPRSRSNSGTPRAERRETPRRRNERRERASIDGELEPRVRPPTSRNHIRTPRMKEMDLPLTPATSIMSQGTPRQLSDVFEGAADGEGVNLYSPATTPPTLASNGNFGSSCVNSEDLSFTAAYSPSLHDDISSERPERLSTSDSKQREVMDVRSAYSQSKIHSRGRSTHSRRSTNSEGEDIFLSMAVLESLNVAPADDWETRTTA